jgi:hypothetical protein
MAQIIPRRENVLGYGIRISLSITQKGRRRESLETALQTIGVGSVRDRGDGISVYELRDMQAVRVLLTQLEPFLQNKKDQARLAIGIAQAYPFVSNQQPEQFLALCEKADKLTHSNDSRNRVHTSKEVREQFIKRGIFQE